MNKIKRKPLTSIVGQGLTLNKATYFHGPQNINNKLCCLFDQISGYFTYFCCKLHFRNAIFCSRNYFYVVLRFSFAHILYLFLCPDREDKLYIKG